MTRSSVRQTSPLSVMRSSPMLRRLAVFMVLAGLLPSLLVFAATYTVGVSVIQSNARKDAYGVLLNAQYNISQTIDTVENIALALAINDQFVSQVRAGDLEVGSLTRAELRQLLENTITMNSSYLSMIYVETEEDTVYTSLYNRPLSPATMRLYDSEHKESILKKGGALYWFGRTEEPEGGGQYELEEIRCASAIFDFAAPNFVGILSLFVRTSVFKANISHLNGVTADQTLLLLDQNRRSLAASSPEGEALSAGIAGVQGDLLDMPQITLDGTVYLSSALQDGDTGWYIVSLRPKDSVLQSMQSRTGMMLTPLLLVPLLCLLSTYLFSGQLSAAVSPLIGALHQIRDGDLSVRSPQINDKLLDLVVDSLNETLDKYNELVRQNSHQEVLLTISRLKILRGQLSPHFLYNTLDSVNWMLIENGQLEMSRIITDLGDLLRYSINESSETVPLREELDIIERYLSICKNRFEDRLSYDIFVQAELREYLLPRFLLQPVVENAVVHGIEKCQEHGSIRIRCYCAEGTAVIDIANDGPSISQEVQTRLDLALRGGGEPGREAPEHIGLLNVQERIRLFAGEGYGLQLLDAIPQGVIVRIRLPGPGA